MFCKETQNTIDTLMRLKTDDNNNNRIASTTRQEREDMTVSIIEQMIQKGENKDFINKIASAVTSKQKQKGEVAELLSLLNLHSR
jgi:hypothetical protein